MQPHCPPPRGFKPAQNILWTKLHASPPPWIKRKKPRGRKAQGIRYERKVLDHLEETNPLPLLRSPWVEFGEEGSNRPRWCQPDGILLDPWEGKATLLEVKYQHTAAAWWQLHELYLPVVSHFLPGWSLSLVEVCKWFDPAISFPTRPAMLPTLEAARQEILGVHILKP